MYIDKIVQLERCYKRVSTMITNANKHVLNRGDRHILNTEDKRNFTNLKAIKDRLKQEIQIRQTDGKKPKINSITILYSDYKSWISIEQVKELSAYFNG